METHRRWIVQQASHLTVVPAAGPPFRNQVCETIADHPLDKGAAAGTGWIVEPKSQVEIERSLLL
jgi:hypothetical protein